MEKSSPSRTAGFVVRKVTVGEVEYTLSQPDKVRKAADEEALIISRRLDMLAALAKACAELPVKQQAAWRDAYISAMMCGIASELEWHAYWDSLWNLAFRFWNALDPKDRLRFGGTDGRTTGDMLIGVSWAYEIVSSTERTKEEIDSLWLAIRCVSQEDALKNSSGSEAPEAKPPMDTPSTEAGLPSTPST